MKITIEGPEGCGKTTLMNALQLLLISAGGQDVRTQEFRDTPRKFSPDTVITAHDVWKSFGKLERLDLNSTILIKTK